MSVNNIDFFGQCVEGLAELKDHNDPQAIIDNDEDLRLVVKLLESGYFNIDEPGPG